jgi:hypothetical protein
VRDPYSSTNPPDNFIDFLPPEPRHRPAQATGFPWGGVLALAVILVVVDWGLLGPSGPWNWLHARLPGVDPLERGLIDDRLALQRAGELDDERPRVTLVGTSRTNAGFQPDLVDAALTPPIDFFELTHTRIFPHELRSMIDDVISVQPDVVLTVLSELEFFTPLKIVPLATGGDLGALAELAAATGPAFVVEHREKFFRMLTVAFSDAYRYRGVLGKTLFDELRRFPRSDDASAAPAQTWPDLLADGEPMPLSPEREASISDSLRAYYGTKDQIVDVQVKQLRSLRPGRHAEIKMDMMDSSIERLLEHGIQVVIIEGSVHPEAYALYDAVEGRRIFREWASRAAEHEDVHFLPIEDLGRFQPIDFRDLSHLNKRGALQFTLSVYDWCSRQLTPAWRDAIREKLDRGGG